MVVQMYSKGAFWILAWKKNIKSGELRAVNPKSQNGCVFYSADCWDLPQKFRFSTSGVRPWEL